MRANTLSIQVDCLKTLDAVPVVVDAVLFSEFPIALPAAQACLGEMIATSTLAALLYDQADARERLCEGVERRVMRVCVPPHLQAHNDACLLAALAEVRRRYGARRRPLPSLPG